MSGIAIDGAMDGVKDQSMRRRIERLLGPGAAILLGAASAFFCFAMPAAIVAAIIAALGVPPAVAESRIALALGFGLAVGAATWFGFAVLDRAARARFLHIDAPEGEADIAPVLRRADAHPDAPPRRPIFAGSDLGTPLDLIDPLPIEWDAPAHPVAPTPLPVLDDVDTETSPPIPVAIEPEPLPTPIPAAPVPPPIAAAPAMPVPTITAMMARLESGLTRKSLVLAGAEPNVTALKREIRPIGGSLRAAVEELQQRTAARR